MMEMRGKIKYLKMGDATYCVKAIFCYEYDKISRI
jgi:hypothetical protein